jgi:alpha-L-rhamnosidase
MKRIVYSLLIFLSTLTIQAQKTVITQLEVDEFQSPIGLDNPHPNFSWVIQTKEYNLNQTHYQIFVATDKVFSKKSVVWDSGKIAADESVYNKYNGKPLSFDTRYYWTVKVWHNQSSRPVQSKISSWTTGLMKTKDWGSRWISVQNEDNTKVNSKSPYFKNDFTVSKKVQSAHLYITSKGMYEAYINGNRVGDLFLTPGWTSYDNRIQYQAYDVTSMIGNENALGVVIGKGWYHGTFMGREPNNDNYKGVLYSFITELVLTYEDGTKESILDDSQWKYTHGAILDAEIYDGEKYNANLIAANWSTFGTPLANAKSAAHDTYDGLLIATTNEMIKRHEVIKPQALITTPSGDKVIDFGQNLVGWVEFTSDGKKDDVVRLQHAEILYQDEFYIENLRGADQLNTFVLNGDPNHLYRPHFTFQGFRYVKVEGMESIDLDKINAVALYSDMKKSGSFSSSDPLINQLQSNIEWGQKGNFLDVPTDCPQRDERLGWTGDAQAFFSTAGFLRDVKNFFDKWMVDLAYDQYDNGLVPSVIPDVLDNKRPRNGGSAGWADVVTIISWNSYLIYGDKEQLALRYESMKKWVDYMTDQSNNGLYKGGDHYGDWLFFSRPNDPPGRSAVSNKLMIAQAFYQYSTELLIKAAEVLNKKDDVSHYQNIWKVANQAFHDEYVTQNGMIMGDTQTAYVLSLKFGLLSEKNRKIAFDRLVENVERYGHLTTGFLGTPYLCEVLSSNGRADLAIKLLLRKTYPSWLYPVTMGATTIWERWNGIRSDGSLASAGMNSYNHYAYGAIGEWMYNNLMGLRINEKFPGYKRYTIAPIFDENFENISGSFDSNYGEIKVAWSRKNGNLNLSIEIPANTSSDVILQKDGAGSWILDNPKLASKILQKQEEADKLNLVLGSGKYYFSYSTK